jgi:hypothetical protein
MVIVVCDHLRVSDLHLFVLKPYLFGFLYWVLFSELWQAYDEIRCWGEEDSG